MSKQYDNNGQGALFKNKDKTPDKPNWADYQGNLNVEGTEYWISAWLKKSKDGKPYMSLSVKPKDSQQGEQRQQAPAQDDGDGDIPF